MQFIGDVGGLSGAVYIVLSMIMSCFVPSAMTRSLLNNNFQKDGGNYRKANNRSPLDPEVGTVLTVKRTNSLRQEEDNGIVRLKDNLKTRLKDSKNPA